MKYTETLMWQELNAAPEAIKNLKSYNAGTLKAIACAVREREITNFYTVARGTSDHAMIYFKYLAESFLGIPVASGAPSAVTVYNAKMNFKNTLVVACSQSGKAADVMEVVKQANENGAITVAITNDDKSPLAQLAKYQLSCCAGEEKSVAATKTFTCQLYIVRMLINALLGTFHTDEFEKDLNAALPEIDKQTDKIYKDFIDAEDCFVLSRGVSSAIAFECALKLQETSYIKARAYYSSDFYHGPMAMVGEGTKVILFAAKNSLEISQNQTHRQDYINCALKMQELGAKLYIITDDVKCFENIKAETVEVPEATDESLTVFYFALTAQMLACKVSTGKGLNPDSPRALKKVTITK